MRAGAMVGLSLIAAFALAAGAEAHGYKRHHGSRVFLGFNFAAPFYPYHRPYYHRPYYPPPRVIYVEPPLVPASPPADRYCREYTAPVTIGGEVVQRYGTACLEPDGSWRIID
jgi:hypothetical protein